MRAASEIYVTHHLRYPRDIVIAAADEAKQSLPRILIQYPDTSELRGPFAKVRVDV